MNMKIEELNYKKSEASDLVLENNEYEDRGINLEESEAFLSHV